MRKALVAMLAACSLLSVCAGNEDRIGDSAAPSGAQQELAAALVPALQTPTADADVTLARFSLVCGRHRNVYGLDFGFLGNLVTDDMVGFAFSGLFNVVGSSRSAFQLAGALNYSADEFVGLQAGAVGIAGTLYGMQFGVLNKVRKGAGFQLGGINVAEQFTGVQIGLINLNLESPVPMAPVFNCYF